MPPSVRAAAPPRRSRAGILASVLSGLTPLWCLTLLAGAASPGLAASHRAGPYAGRPLAEALQDLQARGLNLIFSSDLVPPDLIVAVEPPNGAPRATLDRLLAPFGLEARDGPAGTILVVRGSGPPGSAGSGGDPAGAPSQGRASAPPGPPLRERLRVEAPRDGEVGPVVTVDHDDLEGLPAIGDDAMRKLAALPGIAAADRSAAFSVRGGAPGAARIVLDGLPLDEPFHLKDFAAFSSIVDSRTIDRADVLTGVAPAEYAGAADGVVDLATVDPAESVRTVAGFSTINAGLVSQGRLDGMDAAWLVSARSWRPDALVDSVTVDGDGINPGYNDLLGKLQFRLPGGSLLSAHVLMSQDALDYQTDFGDGSALAADDQRYAWINLKTPLTGRLYAQTLLASGRVSRARSGFTSDAAGGTQVDDARSYGSVALRQDWVFDAGTRTLLKWGFDVRRVEAEYAYRSHVERLDSVDRDILIDPAGREAGLYLAGRLRVAAPLTIEAGVRRDLETLGGDVALSPRLNLAWTLGEGTTLRAGWARSSRSQGIHELPIEDGVVDFSPAERVTERQLDLEHRFRAGLRLSLSIYDTGIDRPTPRFENLFNPFTLFPESEPDRVRIAPDSARARGLEIGLGSEAQRVFAWRASYALASAEDQIGGDWTPRSWDQRHTVKFNMDFRIHDTWRLSLAGQYHTGWPTTEMGAVAVANPDGSTGMQPVLGPRNALRYSPYHRLDLKVTRRFSVGRSNLALYFEVTNLYGRDNVCCAAGFTYLPQPDGSVRVERHDDTWTRQLPVVGMTWEF